jgi:hypothetical protein
LGSFLPPWRLSPTRYSMPCCPPLSRDCGLSSPELFRLFRVPSCLSCRRLLNDGRLPWGFVLLRDLSVGVHIPTGFPLPVYVSPSVFRTLSTIYSSLHLVGLFCPTAAFEISLQGFSPAASRTDFHPFVPSCRSRRPPSGCSPTADPLHLLQNYPLQMLDPLLSFSSFGCFSNAS